MTLAKTDALALLLPPASPRDVLAAATEQANALMEVVEARRLYQVIGTKKYLEAEAWEIILAFNRAHPIPEWVRPMKEAEETVGYVARVNIVQDGVIVSAGEMPCGFDDFPCRGKEGTAKHKAAMSAAQTWALSKAAKMKFAWVAVLGGYEPTPAEEMPRESEGTPSANIDTAYYCQEHDTAWFKRGKMFNYAHPIGDTGKWCTMPSEGPEQPAKIARQPAEKLSGSSTPSPAQGDVRKVISEGFAALGLQSLAQQMKWIQMHCLVPDNRKDWKPEHYQAVADALTTTLTEALNSPDAEEEAPDA